MRVGTPSLFRSFLQGGFESSCHRLAGDGRRLDVIAACRHDLNALQDYSMVRQCGIETVRDALRWHLIETRPGQYDWSSVLPMCRAAREAGVQVIWDLCHYGIPNWLDLWGAEFAPRFAAFAGAAAALLRAEAGDEGSPARIYSLMNEISYWAWLGGERGAAYPFGRGRGADLKRRLVRAAIAAAEAVRAADPRARFIHPEPAIHVVPDAARPDLAEPARLFHETQFEAWDMLAGWSAPELGGREDLLDIVGVNFYWNNQWSIDGRPAGQEPAPLAFGHRDHKPFGAVLADIHRRYRRSILVSETGAEGPSGPAWLSYIANEVRHAVRAGVPIVGICLYPVMDYPGWNDGRHCSCGLIEVGPDWREREIRPEMAERIAEEAASCRTALALPRREALDS